MLYFALYFLLLMLLQNSGGNSLAPSHFERNKSYQDSFQLQNFDFNMNNKDSNNLFYLVLTNFLFS